MAKRESVLEKQCCEFAAKLGGRSIKLDSTVGIPDRMHIFPVGKVLFVEYKHPNGRGTLSEMQILWEHWLLQNGFNYMICENFEDFKKAAMSISGVKTK